MPTRLPPRVLGLAAAVSLLVLLVNAGLALRSVRAVSAAESAVVHTQAVRAEIDGLLSAMKDAETGERGFLITERDVYLEPYWQGLAVATEDVARLTRHLRDEPEQRSDLARASQLVDAKLQGLKEAVALSRTDNTSRGFETARERVRSGRGKAIMDELRAVVLRMDQREERRLATQQGEAATSRRTAVATIAMSAIFGVCLIALTLLLVRRHLTATTAAHAATMVEVGERKRAEGALRESEERLRLFVEHAPAAIAMFDKQMRYLSASRRWVTDYSLGERDLRGLSHYEVFPEIGAEWKAVHARALAGDVVRAEADRFVRADGTEQWLRWEVRPWRDAKGDIGGIVVFSEDITTLHDLAERTRMAAIAKTASDRLVAAVNSMPNAFALFDDQDQLVLCNRPYRELVGESVEGSLIGLTFLDLLGKCAPKLDLPDAAQERYRAARLAGRRTQETQTYDVRMRDGRSLRITDRRTPEGGVVTTVFDMTEDELRAAELRDARAQAEAGSAAKSEFLASMSHELRTPLNAVLGFAQLLQRDKKEPLSTRHRERVEQIVKGGEHLLRLINDVLDLSRIEAGQVSISTEAVNVADVLHEVVQTIEPIAAKNDVHVSIDPVPSGLPAIAADRTRFTQVLMNFASNAVKYNRAGGHVVFTASVTRLGYARVLVRDDGVGIDEEQQKLLFQPFQRAGQETGPIEGTGIGLVITQRLARLMGGDVGFRSRPGEGSEFWVDLPLHESEAPRRRSTIPPKSVRELGKAGPRRVLYVEDNPANVALLREIMSSMGAVEFYAAPNAEEGIRIARAKRPDLIVMDVHLPGTLTGLDALRVLRGAAETSKIPVIALTAAASKQDEIIGKQAGFQRYLTKPLKLDELEEALVTILVPPG